MAQLERFKGSSNTELIQNLKDSGRIKSDVIFNLMCSVDRKHFITDLAKAYVDAPVLAAHDQTISAPHMHAIVLEAFLDKFGNGKRALDIGCGSGYLTTCLAVALGEESVIVGIDCLLQLRDMAEQILKNHYLIYLKNKRVELVVGNGKFGYLSETPYDIIYVGAAAPEVPQTLIDQLAIGGRLLMPVAVNGSQQLIQIDKLPDGKTEKKFLSSVHYGNLKDINIENSVKSIRNITKNDNVINTTIEKMLQKLTEIEEKANNDHIQKREQLQKFKTEILKMQKVVLEDREMLIKERDAELQQMKCKIESMESENKTVREELDSSIKKIALIKNIL